MSTQKPTGEGLKIPPKPQIDPKTKYSITNLEEEHFDLKEMLLPLLQQKLNKVTHPYDPAVKYEGIDYEKREKKWDLLRQERKKMDKEELEKSEKERNENPMKLPGMIKGDRVMNELWFYSRSIHVLLKKVGEYYKEKKCALLEIEAPVNICGDTHGQFIDVIRIFNSCGFPSKNRYLFLGDYVDRGHRSVEVIVFLFCLKLTFPRKVHLLRGNHELKTINAAYGFWNELRARFRQVGNLHEDLHEHFNEVFSWMPLAGCVSKRILCMHGGISPHLNSLDDIRQIPLPLTLAKHNKLACDLLWADPDATVHQFEPNKVRAISHVFGKEQVDEMCKKLDIDLIIRAHQVVEFGYAFFADQRLITVFSASRYQLELDNYAAIVQINKHLEVSFTQLKPVGFEFRQKNEKMYEQATGNVTDKK